MSNFSRPLKGVLDLSDHAKEAANLADNQGFPESNVDVSSMTSVTTHKVLLMKVRQLMKEHVACRSKTDTLLHKGALVSTLNANIAPLSETVRTNRHAREVTHGNVLKESDFFLGYYLVHFFELNKSFYCTDSVIKLECVGPSPQITASLSTKSRSSTIGKTNQSNNLPEGLSDHHILYHIFNNKIFQNPGHEKRTVPEIVALFRRFFPWLSEQRAYKFIQKHRSCRDKVSSTCNPLSSSVNTSADSSDYSLIKLQSKSSFKTPTKSSKASSINSNTIVTPGMLT